MSMEKFTTGVIDGAFLSLALVAAIAGAIGGCSAAAFIVLKSKEAVRAAQIAAYMFIGITSGLVTFVFGEYFLDVGKMQEVIKWSIVMGCAVPLSLFSKNLVIVAVLHKFGWDVKFTITKTGEGRKRVSK